MSLRSLIPSPRFVNINLHASISPKNFLVTLIHLSFGKDILAEGVNPSPPSSSMSSSLKRSMENPSLNYEYHLCHLNKYKEKEAIARGIMITKYLGSKVEPMSHLSLIQIKAKKYIMSGKQSTTVWALGVEKSQGRVSP